MKWLYKLEYKYGKYHIRNLMTILIAGMGIAYVAQMMMPSVDFFITSRGLLMLTREGLLSGQVWRLVSFLFVPPSSGNTIFMFISMYFYYIMGSNLENIWGAFRFNFYYIIGWLGAIASCLLFGRADNAYLNQTLFLAFATLSPDTSFMLMFILPIKAKWMAIAFAALSVFSVIQAFAQGWGIAALGALVFSLINYLIFFGRGLIDTIRNQIRIYKNRRNWRNR